MTSPWEIGPLCENHTVSVFRRTSSHFNISLNTCFRLNRPRATCFLSGVITQLAYHKHNIYMEVAIIHMYVNIMYVCM